MASSVEMPPNKSIAAAGGGSLAGAAVMVLLWATGAQPPMEIVVALTTLANAAVAGALTFFVPHGAITKE